jgi:hypothetical protein
MPRDLFEEAEINPQGPRDLFAEQEKVAQQSAQEKPLPTLRDVMAGRIPLGKMLGERFQGEEDRPFGRQIGKFSLGAGIGLLNTLGDVGNAAIRAGGAITGVPGQEIQKIPTEGAAETLGSYLPDVYMLGPAAMSAGKLGLKGIGKLVSKVRPGQIAEALKSDIPALSEQLKAGSSLDYENLFKEGELGKQALYGEGKNALVKAGEQPAMRYTDYETLDPEGWKAAIRGEEREMHNLVFKRNPTIENANKMQSQLGTRIGQLNFKERAKGLEQAEIEERIGLRKAREVLKGDIHNALDRINPEHTRKYKALGEHFKKNVVPYDTASKIIKHAGVRATAGELDQTFYDLIRKDKIKGELPAAVEKQLDEMYSRLNNLKAAKYAGIGIAGVGTLGDALRKLHSKIGG